MLRCASECVMQFKSNKIINVVVVADDLIVVAYENLFLARKVSITRNVPSKATKKTNSHLSSFR